MNESPPVAGTRAVLIGSSKFANLGDLPAVKRNIASFARLLQGRVWELPSEHCFSLEDPHTPRAANSLVQKAARESTGDLLIYYAGHGLVDTAGKLHLALPDTEKSSLYDTSVPYEWIRREVSLSRARRKFVILDCCFSARAFDLQSGELTPLTDVEGTYILAASSENEAAMAPRGADYTAFTGELLGILENGIRGAGEYLPPELMYQHLAANLDAKGLPVPQQLCRNQLAQSNFARNAGYDPLGGLSAIGEGSEITATVDFSAGQGGAALRATFEQVMKYGGSVSLAAPVVKEVVVSRQNYPISRLTPVELRIESIPEAIEPPIQGTLSLHSDSGIPLHSISLQLTERLRGSSGMTLNGSDYGHTARLSVVNDPGRWHLKIANISVDGRVVPAAALPLLRLLRNAKAGRIIRMVLWQGEVRHELEQALPCDWQGEDFSRWVSYLEDLDRLQSATGVSFPVPEGTTSRDVESVRKALQLIDGKALRIGRGPVSMDLTPIEGTLEAVIMPGGFDLAVVRPSHEIKVGEWSVNLGAVVDYCRVEQIVNRDSTVNDLSEGKPTKLSMVLPKGKRVHRRLVSRLPKDLRDLVSAEDLYMTGESRPRVFMRNSAPPLR
ncbi:caspase family protein [Streptomyces sp. NPDC004009]